MNLPNKLTILRVLLIPVIAGLAYEVIRFAARHMDKRWVRALMTPNSLSDAPDAANSSGLRSQAIVPSASPMMREQADSARLMS